MERAQNNDGFGAFLSEVKSTDIIGHEKPEERSKSEAEVEELPYDQRYSRIEPGSTSFDESTSSWYQLAVRSGSGDISGEDINSLLYNDDGVLGGLFSTRRPRDAMAGFSSGMKTVGKGVAAGVATLVAAPVVGAATEGVSGFFKGMGAGLVAAVALPVTAVGVAGYQMVRGVANTPEAISESNKGRKWDKKNRQWIEYYYSLDDEIRQLEEKEANSSQRNDDKENESEGYVKKQPAETATKTVVDMTYYDLLSISPNASADEIRRQYYRKAKQYHPDKNPDDVEAKEKFQKLGEAYQILADPERRRRYDEYGLGATQDMPVIDSSLIFTILFGSDNLEKYMGKLKMVSLVEIATVSSGQNGGSPTAIEQTIESEQNKRTVILAKLMREKIAPILDEFDAENSTPKEDSEKLRQWRDSISREAKELCNNSFCDAMVEAIGWSYENYGSQYLGKIDTFLGIGGKYAKFQAKTRNMATTWKMASTAIKTAMATQSLQSAMQKQQNDSENSERDAKISAEQDAENSARTQQQFEETLPLILDTMLHITIMDIEDTIRTVAKKLVKDMSVDLIIRKQRALALIEFGSIFQSVANTSNQQREESGDKPDARRKVEEAFIKAAQQRDEKQNFE
ncbi:DnaJ domain-containing protein [Cryptosporidium felis]|nr:DnaJ domain-containing protein [Cryptosporidium felis]